MFLKSFKKIVESKQFYPKIDQVPKDDNGSSSKKGINESHREALSNKINPLLNRKYYFIQVKVKIVIKKYKLL